jgi:hypothetical protein
LIAVTEMDWPVNAGKNTTRDAARTWIKANESRVVRLAEKKLTLS